MKEKYVVVLMGAAICVLLALSIVFMMLQDREKPTITIPDVEIEYCQGSDTAALLEGVKAWDREDKDLTKEVRIDSIIPDKDEKTAVVTYAVYDSSNNVAKEKRNVGYIPAGNESDADTDDPGTDTTADPDTDTVSDPDNINPVDAESDDTEPIDSEPDGEEAAVPTGSNPVITLTEHEFRIERGGDFTPMNRVASAVDDKDDQAALFRRFSVEGDYDINVPGTYELRYYCLDSDGNSSNVETLKLIVE